MKVCIISAGTGSRMGDLAQLTHKALLPLGNKAIITHIIEQFSKDDEFIIPVSHNKEFIKGYIQTVHPELNVTFVDVDRITGKGSGCGYSLLQCKEQLQEQFVFTACDTLIKDKIPSYDTNWIGIKKVVDNGRYCTVDINKYGQVTNVFYKDKTSTKNAYIGIAFVKDYKEFWSGLESGELINDYLEVKPGLLGLINTGLKAVTLLWQDTGTDENYISLLSSYSKNYSFYGKTTDITYEYNGQIIKFFKDKTISKQRYTRGELNKGIFANVRSIINHYYSYDFIEGELLSNKLNYIECNKFLNWAKDNLWKNIEDTSIDTFDFYYSKTLKRLKRFTQYEKEAVINGMDCLTVIELLNSINKSFYKDHISSTFHGDLYPGNIICTVEGYSLIDWRENFGKSLNVGDRYYDLAKFYHDLIFNGFIMSNDKYNVVQKKSDIIINHASTYIHSESVEAFMDFVEKEGYDLKRIKIISALIFINMSPLYPKRLGEYLYYLGRYNLNKVLRYA